MKKAKIIILTILSVATLRLAAEDLSKVPFVLGPTHFQNGDQIVIKEVLATSTNLAVGDKLIVRGRYELKSQQKATLALYLTTNSSGPQESEVQTQTKHITIGSGEFELSRTITRPGYLHLSFYGPRTDFGCVYFGTEPQMIKIKNWNISGH